MGRCFGGALQSEQPNADVLRLVSPRYARDMSHSLFLCAGHGGMLLLWWNPYNHIPSQ